MSETPGPRTASSGDAGREDPPVDAAPVTEYYGDIRRLAPLFAAAGALSLLVGLIPFPKLHVTETVLGGAVFLVLTILAVTLPWSRLPQWLWPAIPIGYIAVVAIFRDADGGATSGLTVLFVLPVVWLAFYGKRSYLVVGLAVVGAALVLPVLLVGSPEYPATGWRTILILLVASVLIGFLLLELVSRDRQLVAQTRAQARLVAQEAGAAEAAREQLASLLRAATETAIIGCDERGTVTFFSTGAEKLLGYPADDVIGRRDLLSFFEPGTDEPRTVDAMLAAGTSRGAVREGLVWTAVRRDGVARRLSLAVTRQTDAAADGYVIVASDVTERDQLARERERLFAVQNEVSQVLVEQNDQLRELTQMKADVVATVSHELRTPLTSIRGYIELLMEDATSALTEDQVRMLRTIDRNSAQLLRVSEDLLEDPGGGRGLRVQFAELDLSNVAREVIESVAAGPDSGRVLLEADEGVLVRGDAARLHQLVANLVMNALKFSPPDGRVLVQVTSLRQFARIDVFDEGPGIPIDERQQLFERFYRLASSTEQGIPGSGLGLAIAKSVVEAHNGTIQVVDTPGWSTTFRIHLPALAVPVVPAVPDDLAALDQT